MSGDEPLDHEDRIEQVLGSKPIHFAGQTVSIELVAWAIKAIEDAGMHPGLKLVSRVIGKQASQRELEPLVNQFYRQRLEDQKRRGRAIGVDHLTELYEVVSIQVRGQVQDELAEEFAAAKEAWEQVEHARGVFEGEREAAARQLELAESIREALQDEMAVARSDRGQALERAERMASALSESQREVLELNRRIRELLREIDELSVVVETRTASLRDLREILTLSRDKEATASRQLKSVASTLSKTRVEVDTLTQCLIAQRASAALTAQGFAALSVSHKKVTNELKGAQAHIARDREAAALRRHELRELKALVAEQVRREIRLTKDLKTMACARDRAMGVAKLARESVDHSRQMVERLMRGALAVKRFVTRGDSLEESVRKASEVTLGSTGPNQCDG